MHQSYALETATRAAGTMLGCLSEILDDGTRVLLRGAGIKPVGRCLEVGAGNGSIARWLADEVGRGGEVVATDIDVVHMAAHPRVRVLEHDIAADDVEALAGPFDLIHARLVLAHLPTRRASRNYFGRLFGWAVHAEHLKFGHGT